MSEDQSSNKKKLPLFHLVERFPDVNSLLKISSPKIETIKDSAIFVLDTNVLLLPYKTSKESLEKIKEVYQKLINENRLFVPEQSIREFIKNKFNLIAIMYESLAKTKENSKDLELKGFPLIKSLDKYSDLRELQVQINTQLKAYRETVELILSEISSWQHTDPVSQIYGELFNDPVIVNSGLTNSEIETDFKRRSANEIPPGYEDAKKLDSGIGDVILWLTILALGKKYKRPLTFITAEKKEDWWELLNKKPISPRLELIDEYRRNSDQNDFSILELSELLELFDATKDIVEEVKSEEIMVSKRVREGAVEIKSWKDEVYDALKAFGGEATLGEIYSYIKENTERELPEAWRESIRKTLQIYSSDSPSFGGREDLFQNLDRGYWALRNYDEKERRGSVGFFM